MTGIFLVGHALDMMNSISVSLAPQYSHLEIHPSQPLQHHMRLMIPSHMNLYMSYVPTPLIPGINDNQ